MKLSEFLASRAFSWMVMLLLGLYAVCMILAPAIQGEWSWGYLQAVWDRWQTLNAAMVALFSSVIAFKISIRKAEIDRAHQFTAAKSFLPHVFSDLYRYFESSAQLLLEALERMQDLEAQRPVVIHAPIPDLPTRHEDVFSRCIQHGQAEVGAYLADFLMRLQIHHARMTSVHAGLTGQSSLVVVRQNVLSSLCDLAELQALVDKIFPFARGMAEFHVSDLVVGDFRNAYLILGVPFDEMEDLERLTKNRIAAKK